MHIAIAGNIGSGKTTLTRMLSNYYGWVPRYESVDFNPYLDDYYKDIPRWSFAMEVYFLKERFKDLIAISQSKETIVQDRSIFEGVYVFTANNRAMGNLTDRDYDTYMELFSQMLTLVRMPDLMIYLRSSITHLVENIQKRGREYFIFKHYKGRVLVLDADTMDFEHNTSDFATIVDKIDALLFGLFK